jgi:DNA-binding CsgD family transcriptional regulator
MTNTASRKERPISVVSLIRSIHSAGKHTDEWPGALESLRQYLDAQVVMLGHHEFTTGTDTAWFDSLEGAHLSQKMAAYAARNPWYMSSEDYVPGRVMIGDDLISQRELIRTDFYHGFLQPNGLLHRLCGVVAQSAGGVYCLTALRSEHQSAFGTQEKAELEVLIEHVTLAMENHWRWQEADDLVHALQTLIDHDANAVMLTTDDAIPIYRNPAAERLLVGHVGLRLHETRLVTVNPADQRILQDVIAQVALNAPSQTSVSPRVVTLACVPPMPPIVVVVRAAGQVFRRHHGGRRGLILMTFRNSHVVHDPVSCPFTRQYALTTAQAKVNAQVFEGHSLPAIATALHISENTVRSHLKEIFHKTNTHGQMDLVHLHARFCSVQP